MTVRTFQPEGSPASQLVQLMRIHGFNKGIDIELATVTAAPPDLKIKIDNMSVELEADDLIVAERLTQYTRTVSINGGIDSTIEFKDELQVGDRVIVASVKEGQSYIILDRVGV
jgi:hypothetical protein